MMSFMQQQPKTNRETRKNSLTDTILKMELCTKIKIWDHCNNSDKAPTTKAAHNILDDVSNESSLTAGTKVIKDYSKDSKSCANPSIALSHMIRLKKEQGLSLVTI